MSWVALIAAGKNWPQLSATTRKLMNGKMWHHFLIRDQIPVLLVIMGSSMSWEVKENMLKYMIQKLIFGLRRKRLTKISCIANKLLSYKGAFVHV